MLSQCFLAQAAKAQMDTISKQLERFTGFDDEMRHLEMQQEMAAKQLAAMQARLEVRCAVRAALTAAIGTVQCCVALHCHVRSLCAWLMVH